MSNKIIKFIIFKIALKRLMYLNCKSNNRNKLTSAKRNK